MKELKRKEYEHLLKPLQLELAAMARWAAHAGARIVVLMEGRDTAGKGGAINAIREHLNRLVDGDIIWAPAIDGAFVLSTRGGDFDLQLGTDVSIGYLSHDAESVQLYLQETLTFLCYTAEASVALSA